MTWDFDLNNMINAGSCCVCKCIIYLPKDLYNSAKHSESISFYCAYGHKQHYPQGETELDKVRRERDRLQQQIAWKEERLLHKERQLNATRGVVTRIKRRVGNGVCPCCNRTFSNLQQHMNKQHPGWKMEAAE